MNGCCGKTIVCIYSELGGLCGDKSGAGGRNVRDGVADTAEFARLRQLTRRVVN